MDNDYVVIVDGELYHYGTKGMKWGRRLFQNKDGSLTALGKKRYLNSDGTLNKAGKKMRKEEADALKAREAAVKKRESEARSKARQDAKKAELDAREKALDNGKVPKSTKAAQKAAAAETKSMSEMSNAELKAAVERKKAENEYRQYFPEKVPKGKQFVDKLANDVIKPALVEGGKNIMTSMLDRVADRIDPYSKKALQATYDKLELQTKIEDLTKGKPWHRLTPDEKAKMYKLERDMIEDARADAAYAEGAENRKLARVKAAKEAEAKIVEAQNQINKQKDAERDRKAERKRTAAEVAAKAADKKQAEKDARAAEKQAKKDAKAAEKQAKKDAKAEAKKAAEMEKYNEYQEAYKKSIDIDNIAPNTTYSSKGGERTRTGKAIIAGLLGAPSDDSTSSTRSSSNVGETSTALISKIRTMTNSGNKTYSEIANQLGVSVSTVQNYSNGKKAADRFMTYDEKGNFVGYWSAIKVDDANVI